MPDLLEQLITRAWLAGTLILFLGQLERWRLVEEQATTLLDPCRGGHAPRTHAVGGMLLGPGAVQRQRYGVCYRA